MSRPTLSVLIDTYNHERYVEQAVVSAIEQDFPQSDYEIVVVDDGSTDRTAEIVRKFAPRVRLIKKKNGGQASAFNAGFRELRGEVVAFLDGDDWFAQGKLRIVMETLARNPQVAGVGHGYRRFNDDTKQTEDQVPTKGLVLNLDTPASATKAHDSWSYLLMGALTVRKKAIEEAMPVPEVLRFCADVPILMAALFGGVCVVPEPLFYYRQHSGNLFSIREESDTRLKQRAEMTLLSFDKAQRVAVGLGARPECVAAFLHPQWVETSRSALRAFGGSRRRLLKTEMRALGIGASRPSLAYQLLKYVAVAGATFALTPQQFYRAWGWYGRWRQRFAKAAR